MYFSSLFLLFMAFILSMEFYLSVRNLSVESWWSPSASFLNDLYPGLNLGKFCGRFWYFSIPNVFYLDLELDPFLVAMLQVISYSFSFLEYVSMALYYLLLIQTEQINQFEFFHHYFFWCCWFWLNNQIWCIGYPFCLDIFSR